MTRAELGTDRVLAAFAEEVGDRGPVAVAGSRTRWSCGGLPLPTTRFVRAPSGVVAHLPEEMTVTVRAGTLVAELSAALAEGGQRCALPDRGGTVGGAVAVGEHHLEVLTRGTLRASVLEVRYVSAEGRLIRGGGPTVKNVSGFDLPRLFTGSLGTLGLIAEVILRTNPIPAAGVWLTAPGLDPFRVRAVLRGAAVVLHDGDRTWLRLEGHPGDVTAERGLVSRIAPFTEVEGPPDLPEHRWSLAPSALRTLDRSVTGGHVASVGVGTVFAHRPQPARTLDPVLAALNARVKANFDPTARLNPGRSPETR